VVGVQPDLQERAPRWLVLTEWLLTLGGLAVIACFQPTLFGDGTTRWRALDTLMRHGDLTADRYSLVGPLFSAPLWVAGWLTDNPVRVVARYNQLLFALALAAIFLLLRGRVNPTVLRRFLFVLVSATMVTPNAINYYGEMFSCVTVGVGILATFDRRPGRRGGFIRLTGWVAIVIGVANTFALLPALVLVAGWHTVKTRRLRYVLPVVGVVAMALTENWLRRGGPFVTGYEVETVPHNMMPYSGRDGFPYPFLLGVLSILFSFGKGLVFYIPGLALYTRSRRMARFYDTNAVDLHGAYLMWLLFVAGGVAMYAKWWDWSGEMVHGPRFLLVAIIPASLALAVWISDPRSGAWASLATLTVLLVAVWGAAIATMFGYRWPPICFDNHYALDALCLYTPDYSGLWYPVWSKPEFTLQEYAATAYYCAVFVVLTVVPASTVLRSVRSWAGVQDWGRFMPRHWRL
jgi:hypothetical protein